MQRGDGFKQNASRRVLWGLAAGAWVTGCTGMIVIAKFQPAQALPSYTETTGASCGRCHTSSTGGSLTAYGKAFVANGHKLPANGAKKAKSAPAAPATVPPPQAAEGRALDYVPWTLKDPYYSHFLYSSGDYHE